MTVGLDDAGGGAGTWNVVASCATRPAAGVRLTLAADRRRCRASSTCHASVARRRAPGDVDAYVELRRGADVRRIPVWGRVTAGRSQRHADAGAARAGPLPRHHRGQRSLRDALPLPGDPARRRRHDDAARARARVPHPAHEARRQLRRRHHAARPRQPRRAEGRRRPRREPPDRVRRASRSTTTRTWTSSASRRSPPARSRRFPATTRSSSTAPSRAGAGSFAFRYWVNDVTPPTLRLRTPRRRRQGSRCASQATDAGAGVYPQLDRRRSSTARRRRATFRDGVVSISTCGLGPGTHRLRLRVSDYQESKNTENVARSSRTRAGSTATFRVRLAASLRLPVALLDRRERVEVALDGADELLALVVGRDHPKLLLPPLRGHDPCARRRRSGAPGAASRPRPRATAARTSNTSHGQLTRRILAAVARMSVNGLRTKDLHREARRAARRPRP